MNKKALSICFSLTFGLASLGSVSAFAKPADNRYYGQDRYETSASIVSNGWSGSSDYAVLATGEDFPDSLSAVTLAAIHKAPIILTQKDTLTAVSDAQIQRLNVKNIYIVGGTGVISSGIETTLKNRGINVTRIGGQDRYETAVDIANQIPLTSGEIAITYGFNFADALSMAPIAAKKGMPLLVVPKTLDGGKLPASVQAYLDANKGKITKTYVLGGTDYISDEVAAKFPNTERVDNISADKNCDKNAAIVSRFASSLDFSTVYIATGKDFPDTLAGAALAALNGSPILFINDNSNSTMDSNIKTLITNNASVIKNVVALGGTGVVADSELQSVIDTIPDNSGSTSGGFDVTEID